MTGFEPVTLRFLILDTLSPKTLSNNNTTEFNLQLVGFKNIEYVVVYETGFEPLTLIGW